MNSLSFWPFENVDTAGTWLTESGVKDALPVGYDELTLIEYLYRHSAVNNSPYHCVEDFFKGLTVDHPDDHEIDFSQQLNRNIKRVVFYNHFISGHRNLLIKLLLNTNRRYVYTKQI
jgi:hypothetical protein